MNPDDLPVPKGTQTHTVDQLRTAARGASRQVGIQLRQARQTPAWKRQKRQRRMQRAIRSAASAVYYGSIADACDEQGWTDDSRVGPGTRKSAWKAAVAKVAKELAS